MSKSLDTKAQICSYMQCGWERIEMLINKYKFPARKLGGLWVSDTDAIEEWRKKVVQTDKVKDRIDDLETKIGSK